MPVVGIHRKSKRLIKVVISTNKITNFRVKKIYKPRLVDYIRENSYYDQWKKSKNTESILEEFARQLSKQSK